MAPQGNVAVALQTYSWEVPGSNLCGDTDCPDSGLLVFLQSRQANSGMLPRLGYDHFHPNLFQKSPYTGHITVGAV